MEEGGGHCVSGARASPSPLLSLMVRGYREGGRRGGPPSSSIPLASGWDQGGIEVGRRIVLAGGRRRRNAKNIEAYETGNIRPDNDRDGYDERGKEGATLPS